MFDLNFIWTKPRLVSSQVIYTHHYGVNFTDSNLIGGNWMEKPAANYSLGSNPSWIAGEILTLNPPADIQGDFITPLSALTYVGGSGIVTIGDVLTATPNFPAPAYDQVVPIAAGTSKTWNENYSGGALGGNNGLTCRAHFAFSGPFGGNANAKGRIYILDPVTFSPLELAAFDLTEPTEISFTLFEQGFFFSSYDFYIEADNIPSNALGLAAIKFEHLMIQT